MKQDECGPGPSGKTLDSGNSRTSSAFWRQIGLRGGIACDTLFSAVFRYLENTEFLRQMDENFREDGHVRENGCFVASISKSACRVSASRFGNRRYISRPSGLREHGTLKRYDRGGKWKGDFLESGQDFFMSWIWKPPKSFIFALAGALGCLAGR